MESVVFVQDIKNNTWVTCEDETYKTEDLEKIACGIVLYHFDDCFFYNSKERHWRRIDGVQSVEDFQGLMCYHDLSDRFERQISLNMDRAIFPFRWRICLCRVCPGYAVRFPKGAILWQCAPKFQLAVPYNVFFHGCGYQKDAESP